MSDDLERLATTLRIVQEQLGSEAARVLFEQQTVALSGDDRVRLHLLTFGSQNQFGAVTVGDIAAGSLLKGAIEVSGTLRGAAVGVNQGTVQLFFSGQLPSDSKQLLDSYLETLIAEHGRLRLGKLLGKEQSGREQAVMPALLLSAVYTAMATNTWIAGEMFAADRETVLATMDAGNPAQVLPEQVRLPIIFTTDQWTVDERNKLVIETSGATLMSRWELARREIERAPDSYLVGCWVRPETPLDAVAAASRLVLLGRPGSGKSTVLRYLTVRLAEELLARRDPLQRLPFFCQLGRVAQQLGPEPDLEADLAVLINTLLQPLVGVGGLHTDLHPSILQSWRAGQALICLDGLDEVSGIAGATPAGQPSRRERIAAAIRQLAHLVGHSQIIVTCRTKPYEQDAAWQLREDWTVRTLQPFVWGQVRHFAPAWYAQTCTNTHPKYQRDQAHSRALRLVAALERRATLQELTASPLLLTMLVLLDYNHKELPEKRVDVYEELVKLLLDRWEGVRSSETDYRQQSIGERLGLPHLTTDDLRPVIHDLAFTAHCQAVDGRGFLSGALLREKLDGFFAHKLNPANPRAVPRDMAVKCSVTFEQVLHEETGLVQEESDETYVLPHLTFEEYLAACYLAGREDVALAYAQWQAQGDRWREVLLLLMGRMLRQEKLGMAFAWLQLLVAERCGTEAKIRVQRQRDALFAAACYTELGCRAYLASGVHDVIGFEGRLRAALIELLERPDPTLPVAQRIEAGQALGDLGDPRFPATLADWRSELARRSHVFGELLQTDPLRRVDPLVRPYWCYIRPGTYRIGAWEESDSGAEITLPAFWIARFPLTVAQYTSFVQTGYSDAAQRWWTPAGWRWKIDRQREQPLHWKEWPYDGPNQPVIGVTWYEATAFCAWLTEQLQDELPAGYAIRLPTEAEWEVAAAYDVQMQRQFYPWGEEEPSPERAIYSPSSVAYPAPVGCCPSGAASCGALDMAGNVWEVTTSSYRAYPAQSGEATTSFTPDDYAIAWRGGSWREDSLSVHCGARVWARVGIMLIGARLVVAPALTDS